LDRQTWFLDPDVLALIEGELARWIDNRGIGEFHVFDAADAGTPQVKRLIDLAVACGVWLHARCGEPALEAQHAHDSRTRVVWAHSGIATRPEVIAQYLARHPAFIGELSYRYDVTRDGDLTPA
jgi:hypothetical protein